MNDLRQRHCVNLDRQMEVVGHETESVYLMTKAICALCEKPQHSLPVPIVKEQGLSVIAAGDTMIDRSRVVNSSRSSHKLLDGIRSADLPSLE